MEFLLKGGSEKLYFPSASTAPETACEELSEGAQPMFILLHLHQETETGQTQERVLSAQISMWYLVGTWDVVTETKPGIILFSAGASRRLHLWAHMGWGAGTEVHAPCSWICCPQNYTERGSCFPPVEQNFVFPCCDPLLVRVLPQFIPGFLWYKWEPGLFPHRGLFSQMCLSFQLRKSGSSGSSFSWRSDWFCALFSCI